MTTKQKLHQAQLNDWAAKFKEQKASGLTARQWCEQNDLSIHKYNYWKHKLKEEIVSQVMPDIVQLSIPDQVPLTGTVPSKVDTYSLPDRPIRANRPNRAAPNIRLCIDGVAFELEPPVSEDFLKTLIRAVHYA